MPLGPKLVLALLMLGLASGIFWAFVRLDVGIAGMITIVLSIGLLIDLYTPQTAISVL